MRTADEVFSYAREIRKSQLRNGQYVPATKLSEMGREKQKQHLQGAGYNKFRGPAANAPSTRDITGVYDKHGIQPYMAQALQEQTRPSKVHPNVVFGPTVTPQLEDLINNNLSQQVLRTQKRPLSIHYGNLGTEGSGGAGTINVAAAAGSHQTTGNMGRVVLNTAAVTPDGRVLIPGGPSTFRDMINHEAVHANTVGKNPRRMMSAPSTVGLSQSKALGEEARADAQGVRGTGLYERGGIVKPESVLRQAEMDPDYLRLDAKTKAQYNEAIAGHRNYHRVHEKVQEAYRMRESDRPPTYGPSQQTSPQPPPTGSFQPPRDSSARFTPPPPRVAPDNLFRIRQLGTLASRNPYVTAGAIGGAIGGGIGGHLAQRKRKRDQYKRDNEGQFTFGRVSGTLAKRDRSKFTSDTALAGGLAGGVYGAGLGVKTSPKVSLLGATLGGTTGTIAGGKLYGRKKKPVDVSKSDLRYFVRRCS